LKLVDTDVIIWYMRGNEKAADVLDNLNSIMISAVTYMELIQGMRNKAELSALETTLTTWKATIFPVNEEISDCAVSLVKQHFHSYSLMLADALIAATALHYQLPLLTGNDKHYRMITDLNLEKFRIETKTD